MVSFVIALMVRHVSAKVGQGIFLVFLHLLAVGKSSRQSFDAAHVGYPGTFFVKGSSEAVATDIEARQCPVILDGASKCDNTYKEKHGQIRKPGGRCFIPVMSVS